MRSSNNSNLLMKLMIGTALVLITSFVGCSQKSQLDGGDITSLADAITITASPNSITVSVTTIIEATVSADGSAIPNEIVTFTVSPAGIGTLLPAVDTSDAQGFTAAVFTPTSSGTATITASTANGTISSTVVIAVADDETSTGNSLVWAAATPNTVTTGSSQTINIRIEIRDSLQGAAPESTVVIIAIGENFTDTNEDGYFTLGVDDLTDFNSNGWWDAFGAYDSVTYADANGVVNVVLVGQADVARTISVRATIRDDVMTGFDKEYIYFEPLSQSSGGGLGMTANVSKLIADGTSTATITLEVRDETGDPALAGTEILLTAGEKFQDNNGDGSFTAGIDQLLIDANNNGLWDSFGSITSPVTTNALGIATATFTSDTDPYDVYIQAVVNDVDLSGSREMMLMMVADVDLHTIFLYSDSMHLSVIHTGGIQTSELHAIGYDAYGYPVPAGYPIVFTITASPGGGEHLYINANTSDPYTALTDSTGTATVSITSGTVSGTIRVRATYLTTLSEATQILVSAGPPKYITVAADTCNIHSWLCVNCEQEIIAIVSDTFLNPVNDSIMVYFSCDEGTMKSHEKRTFDLEGRVSSLWFSNRIPDSADGQVWIWAETAGGTVRDSSYFWSSGPAAFVSITGLASSVPADGKTKLAYVITALDINGNPVVAGTKYSVFADPLQSPDGIFQGGCDVAWDEGEITSVILDEDYSMTGSTDNGIGKIVVTTFTAGYNIGVVDTITITTGTAYIKQSSIDCQATAAPSEIIPISVIIKDRPGNPLGDHALVLSAVSGTPAGVNQTTSNYGEASGFSWTAPAVDGTYTIIIVDNDPRGQITLAKTIVVSST